MNDNYRKEAREKWEEYRISQLPYTTHFPSLSYEEGYIKAKAEHAREMRELRVALSTKPISDISWMFSEPNVNEETNSLKKELGVYKAAYSVLREGICEANQSMTCSVNVGKILTEASKKAAEIMGEEDE